MLVITYSDFGVNIENGIQKLGQKGRVKKAYTRCYKQNAYCDSKISLEQTNEADEVFKCDVELCHLCSPGERVGLAKP